MNTLDITRRFRTAASHISGGSLVQDDHFSLFEAVGALEIGDTKMDSGCLAPGESLDLDFDMSQPILPEELIWLMDEMLNREVAWLMGYPFSQTLFTSVHIDRLLWPDPKTLQESSFIRGRNADDFPLTQRVLRAYCLLLVKICDYVLSMVTSQHFYEEEDLTTQLFNRELLHRFSGASIGAVAHAITDELGESDIDSNLREAILIRLKFRIEVLEMLMQHANGQSPPTSRFPLLHAALDMQDRTNQLGSSVEEAFSTKLQRRLASTVPPRPMVTVSMAQAWSFWHQMLDDCKNVFAVYETTHSQDLLTAYQILAYSTPQPSTYPRALLQSFLSLDGMVTSRSEPWAFLQEDVQSLTLPASPLLELSHEAFGRILSDNPTIAACLQTFKNKFENTFVNVYRALCLNSCRIRRTFCHALEEWDALQAEIEEADTLIHEASAENPVKYGSDSPPTFSFGLSSWVYHHKLNILQLTILMGFEQMIYAPHELAGMYWYLSSIADIHLSHLERISFFVTAKDAEVKQSKMARDVKEQAIKQCKLALDRLYRQYSWTKAVQLLSATLHTIFVVLHRWDVFHLKEPVYSTNDLRYEIRMKPFLNLSIPEALSPEDFQKETERPGMSVEALLDQAMTTAAAAKKAWEVVSKMSWHYFPLSQSTSHGAAILDEKRNTDAKDCLKAAIATSICVMMLKTSGNEEWKLKAQKAVSLPAPGDNGRWHRWWIVPSLPPA